MTNGDFLVGNCHEWDRWVNFDGLEGQDPLAPYFALARIVDDANGSRSDRIVVDGVEYETTLWYRSGDDVGIADLNVDRVRFDSVREYHIKFEAVDDELGAHSGSFHLSPRSPDMVDHDDDPLSLPVPDDFLGLSVREQGSNLPFDRYPRLLREWARAVGMTVTYFSSDAIRSTRIVDASVEVRLHTEESGPLHALDGTISRISRLLSSDREGYSKHVSDDRGLPGNYHTATIGEKRAGELLKGHSLPKEVKHYYDDNPPSDLDHPLAHPKLCVSYQTSLDDGKPDDRDAVWRELHEVLLNVLRWDGLPVDEESLEEWDGPDEADRGPYVEDAFWSPNTERMQRRLPNDPLPDIKDEQESLVVRHLADGLEDSDFDVLERLVADGGRVAPADLAESEDWHISTIYRALDRLDDLVDRRYGEVHLASNTVAEEVANKVRWAREVAVDAAESAAAALERITDLGSGGDRVKDWLDTHAREVRTDDDGELVIDLGRREVTMQQLPDEVSTLLARLRHNWLRAGLDDDRLVESTILVAPRSGTRQRYSWNSPRIRP